MTAPTVSATSARSPVTMTIRLIPASAQRADGAAGVGADGVVEDQHPGRLAVDARRTRSARRPAGPAAGPAWPTRGTGHPGPVRLAHRHPVTGDDPADPLPGNLLDIARQDQLAATLARRADDRAGQDVLGYLIQGRGQADRIVSAGIGPAGMIGGQRRTARW